MQPSTRHEWRAWLNDAGAVSSTWWVVQAPRHRRLHVKKSGHKPRFYRKDVAKWRIIIIQLWTWLWMCTHAYLEDLKIKTRQPGASGGGRRGEWEFPDDA
jgi:hypothetical protein